MEFILIQQPPRSIPHSTWTRWDGALSFIFPPVKQVFVNIKKIHWTSLNNIKQQKHLE